MDIRAFFDTVPWDLVLRAVKYHCREPWVLLYVKRWLEAPLRLPDGTISERTMGTPQGSAISPLLANLFMHYAFDAWMARAYPAVTFERYCDDAVVHCRSKVQAQCRVAYQSKRKFLEVLVIRAKIAVWHARDGAPAKMNGSMRSDFWDKDIPRRR